MINLLHYTDYPFRIDDECSELVDRTNSVKFQCFQNPNRQKRRLFKQCMVTKLQRGK